MKAFHNDEAIKQKYVARVRAHQASDHLIRGTGWDGSKGCAVGCTLEAYDHARYEKELGIPEWLARLEDTIFEGVTEKYSRNWPARFLEAVNVGSDLEKIKIPFLIFILERNLESMDSCQFDKEKFPDVQKAIEGSRSAVQEMIRCHREGLDWSAAESARSAACCGARSAAGSAAYEHYADKLLELIRECK